MVDIRKAVEELKEKTAGVEDYDSVTLCLTCTSIPTSRNEPNEFWVNFEEDGDFETVKLGTGSMQDDAGLGACVTTEEEVAKYGEWYRGIAGYCDDIDEFRDIPVEELITALEKLDFSSYEIKEW